MFVIRNGLRWCDAPAADGPHKTIDNRFIRWSRLGVFNRIFAALAASLLEKGDVPRRIGRTKGGLTRSCTPSAMARAVRSSFCSARGR
jgi:transposase